MSKQSKEARRERKARAAADAANKSIGQNDRQPGQLMGDSLHSRADSIMAERAIRHKWNIPEATFEKLPQEVLGIFHKKAEGTRERLRAAELLIKMHGQNEGDKTEVNVNQQVAIVNPGTPEQEAAAMDATIAPPNLTLWGQKVKISGNGNGQHNTNTN